MDEILQEIFRLWGGQFNQPSIYGDALSGKEVLLPADNLQLITAFYDVSRQIFKGEPPDDFSLSGKILRTVHSMFFSKPNRIIFALLAADRSLFIPFLPKEYFRQQCKMTEDEIKIYLKANLLQKKDGLLRQNPYQMIGVQIGEMQTCSPPYTVALYAALSTLVNEPKKVFDFGSGCGYQAAIYAYTHTQAEVFGLEYFPQLSILANSNLRKAEERNKRGLTERVKLTTGDGKRIEESELFVKNAPYDFISVDCMLPAETDLGAMTRYLSEGGVLAAPIASGGSIGVLTGNGYLNVIQRKGKDEFETAKPWVVSFVPLQ